MSARAASSRTEPVRIAVDIGGTFTDGIALGTRSRRIWLAKRLTTPDDPGAAVSTVIGDLLAAMDGDRPVRDVVHGTTLVTNTIIERDGARTGLLVTRGTADVLDIGREVRYDLYDLDLTLPAPLVERALRREIDERTLADGAVHTALDDEDLQKALAALARRKVESVAVCFLHAYANPAHEQAAGEAIRARLPGVTVSLSSAVAPVIREFERMSTTVANAYVQPRMARYLGALHRRLEDAGIDAPLRIMISSGGFTSSQAAAAQPIALLESGPAGGVLSAVNTAIQLGVTDLLALDMGGTTAKACVVRDGRPDVAHEFEAARERRFTRGSGLPMLIPSIDLIEIGAGGGSIAHASALGLLNVGPRSAGAEPGPACYGRGGTDPTVTDADLLLGFLDEAAFLGGDMPLDRAAAERGVGALGKTLGMGTTDVAWGIHDLVNENMAGAARVHVAEKGLDPRRFTLVATGGAGPVHAVEVAHKLGLGRVLCTVAAGVGSCLGLLAAPVRVDRSTSRLERLDRLDWWAVKALFASMRADAEAELGTTGARGLVWRLGAEVRYAGQGNAVEIVLPARTVGPRLAAQALGAFEERYRELYGALVPGAAPEVITWRLSAQSKVAPLPVRLSDVDDPAGRPRPLGRRPIYLPERRAFGAAPVYARYALGPGARLRAPLVLQERESTIVVARTARVEIMPDLTVSVLLARAREGDPPSGSGRARGRRR